MKNAYRRLGPCAWLAVAGLALLAGCGSGEPKVAADVEGTPITSAQVTELYDVFARTAEGQETLDGSGPDSTTVDPKQIRAAVLSYRIKVAFVETLARREGVDVPETAAQESIYDALAEGRSLQAAGYRSQDLEAAAHLEALSKAIAAKLLPDVTVTEAELAAAFRERGDIVGKSFRATTDLAFMVSQDSASQLRSALDGGASFHQATQALSAQTLEAQTVDITSLSPLSPEVLKVVRTLAPGQTAEPIRYDLGGAAVFVVAHQEKRVDLPALTLAQAAPELRKAVIDHKRFLFFQDWLKQEFLSAHIRVNHYYGSWNPSFQAVV
jgi:hypothetical protein